VEAEAPGRVSAGGTSAAEAAAEEAFQREVAAQLPRNYTAHLAHGLLSQTGFRLVNAPTFVPTWVDLVSGGSPLAVGAARALQSLGMCLSPLLGATAIEHRRRVLPVGFVVGGLMRAAVLGLALTGFLLAGRQALVAIFAFLLLFGFFLGMQGVVFNFLLAKVIPPERRGRLLGSRNALATLAATAVGALAGRLVETDALGSGYGATFMAAFALTTLGLASLLFVREPASPTVREPARVRRRLAELPALLRSDPAFTRFFLARALATMGHMSVPFYVIYAGTRTEIGGAELGNLTAAFLGAQGAGNLVWGSVADRRGFRLVFLLALSLWIASALLLMATHDPWLLALVLAGLGAGLGGFMMSSQNLVLEFGTRDGLPMRIAVANSASELVGAFGPLLAGVLITVFSYPSVFWTAIGFQLAAVACVLLFVPEPRGRREAPPPSPR
jgi:MFS family permease